MVKCTIKGVPCKYLKEDKDESPCMNCISCCIYPAHEKNSHRDCTSCEWKNVGNRYIAMREC